MQSFVDFVRRSFVELPNWTTNGCHLKQGPFISQMIITLCAASYYSAASYSVMKLISIYLVFHTIISLRLKFDFYSLALL